MITYELGKNYYETDEQSQAERTLVDAIKILGIPKKSNEEKEQTNEMSKQEKVNEMNEQENGNEKIDEKQNEEKKMDEKVNEINQKNGEENKSDKKQSNEYEILEIEKLTPIPISYDFVFEYADSCNFLGMIWTNRADYKKSEKYFRLAEDIYENCKR